MTVEHVSEGRGAHSIQKGLLDAKKKLDSAKHEGVDRSVSDQVEISRDAQRLKQRDALIEELRTSLERMPEAREEKVREAASRIRSEHYEKREVLEHLADALLEEPGGSGISEASVSATSGNHPDVRPEKIEQAQERIEQGYYDRDDVIETLVQMLLG